MVLLSSWMWVLPFCSLYSPFFGVLWFIFDWQGFIIENQFIPLNPDGPESDPLKEWPNCPQLLHYTGQWIVKQTVLQRKLRVLQASFRMWRKLKAVQKRKGKLPGLNSIWGTAKIYVQQIPEVSKAQLEGQSVGRPWFTLARHVFTASAAWCQTDQMNPALFLLLHSFFPPDLSMNWNFCGRTCCAHFPGTFLVSSHVGLTSFLPKMALYFMKSTWPSHFHRPGSKDRSLSAP